MLARGPSGERVKKGLVGIPAIMARLERLLSWRRSENGKGLPHTGAAEQPLRAELFSVDQLERHAKALAATHQLATGRAPDKLIPRLGRERADSRRHATNS